MSHTRVQATSCVPETVGIVGGMAGHSGHRGGSGIGQWDECLSYSPGFKPCQVLTVLLTSLPAPSAAEQASALEGRRRCPHKTEKNHDIGLAIGRRFPTFNSRPTSAS